MSSKSMGESTSMLSSRLSSLRSSLLDSDSSASDDETISSSVKSEVTDFEALLTLLEDELKDKAAMEVDADVWVLEDEIA